MSSFLSHIVHGVESGLTALATTGNPYIAAGAGLAGAVSDDAASGGAVPPQPAAGSPLLEMLNAERPTEQSSVSALSNFAGTQQPSPYADLIAAA